MEESEILKIILEYIKIIKEILEKGKDYTTTTKIVPHDFFHDNNGENCSTNVLFKDFKTPIILFNDLKSSTKLIEELESKGKLCIYTIYMYYSSQMMGKILDILNGKIVECTGDGHYSIFLEDEIDENKIKNESDIFFNKLKKYKFRNYRCRNYRCRNYIFRNYIINFDFNEIKYIYPCLFHHRNIRIYTDFNFLFHFERELSNKIRVLFFYIFAVFNIEINLLLENKINNKFLTRIGCKQGACKITRIIIDGHIKQDKLIGAVVHHAAHQSSGK